MYFKIGDRVNVYASFMSNEPLRGKVVEDGASQKDTILLKIRFDNFRGISSHEEWIHSQQCRKLVKKPIKFEVGDRCVIQIDGKKQKGTILHNNYHGQDYYVEFDEGHYGFFPINYRKSKCQYVKKLVKKKPQFNINDRVILKGGSMIGKKGRIVDLTHKGELAEVLIDDWHSGFAKLEAFIINTDHLKKLVKKKIEFKVGDRVIFKQSNCDCEELRYLNGFKGTINKITVMEHGTTIATVDDVNINVKHLKKLVKKEKFYKSEQKPFFKWMSEIVLKNLEKDKEPKLLPCPFCRCEDCYITQNPMHDYSYYIRCPKCGSDSGERDSKERAIEHWNYRSFP
jgi:Lar family restriction alleviation protein